jgi:uncharacterized protein YndB with AHSA1/START domain
VIEPLRFTLVVSCPPEHAFLVWTAKASHWWPRSHTVTAEPGLEIVFQPRVGGRIYERIGVGTEIEWGQVTAWEPPRRLSYLWHIRADRADATEVDIRFTDQGDSTTRVDIEHHGWERLGKRGLRWREVNTMGWNGVLPDYLRACSQPELSPG